MAADVVPTLPRKLPVASPFYIMESVKTRAEWDTMMENAGPLRPIRVVLDDLSANRQYGARPVAIEKKWNVNLHDDPPAPKKK
jgi:hypothetical protein